MDFTALTNKIVACGRRAFDQIKAQYPDHQFYFFGLYTNGDYSTLLPACLSYQGLKQIIAEYQQQALTAWLRRCNSSIAKAYLATNTAHGIA